MKKLFLAIIFITIALNGCANTSKEHQAAIGAALGGLAGAGLGAVLGGKQGAAIGALAGVTLGGVVAYNFASDPYTQSAAQQAESWKKQTGVAPETVKASGVTENGVNKRQIDVQKMNLSNGQVISNDRLSDNIKQQLSNASFEAKKTGGIVHVLYPQDTSANVLQDLRSTGVSLEQHSTLNGGFTILLARNQSDLNATKLSVT